MGKTKTGRKVSLPELALGKTIAREDLNVRTMAERLAHGVSSLEYQSADPSTPFRSVSSLIRIGDLQLAANASTPVEFRATDPQLPLLILPLVGRGLFTQDRRQIAWDADGTAAFIPQMDTVGQSGRRSVVGITIERETLEELASQMLDRDPGGARILDLETPRALPLAANGMRFDQIFRHLLATIDGCLPVPELLDRSGLDDTVRRLMVLLLKPDAFCEEFDRPLDRRNKLGHVCDYIRANLNHKITLSILQNVSGLSPRVLQYAFRERYGCSPMQWVADQRLDQVRAQLLAAPQEARVSEIAYRYFSNLGDFSRRYRTKFGELPSNTALRRRK